MLLDRVAFARCLTLLLLLLPLLTTAQVIKSPYDTREFEALRLDNNLRVLLVSDAEAEKAAVSMDVGVGSGANPLQRPGLAHFLEHMLFLGTEAFPEADAYQHFISSHGGSHNAFTAYENTNYFFDIDPNALPGALDRFSQFFISPLFSPEYVDRERHAVDAEFQARRRDDRRRAHEVTKQIMNPDHGWSRFAVGDLRSLSDNADSNIRDELIDFYQRYYSANLMSLVVIGPQPLDELRELVTARFADIPDFSASAHEDSTALFTPGTLPTQLNIRSLRQIRTLSLTFPVPSLREHWREKPLYFLGSLIGYEGEGSLLSLLREEGLATGLSAGTAIDLPHHALFQVDIQLTDAGLEQYEQVTELFFAFLQQIGEQGIRPDLYLEEQQLAELQFRFRDQRPPQHEATMLAQMQQRYPVEYVLNAWYRLERFDAELIAHYLAHLTPDNLLLTLMAPNVSTDQLERRYNAAYAVTELDPAWIERWQTPESHPALQVRSLNPLVPENLQLVERAAAQNEPVALVDEPGIQLWFQQDQQFQRPRADIFFALMTHQALASAEHAVMLDLYTRMVNDELNELLYDASLAGLSANLYPHLRGISLQLSGYNDKQAELLARLLPVLRAPQMDEARFERVRQQLRERLHNLREEPPYQLALQQLFTDLMARWSTQDRLDVLEQIDLAQLQHFLGELYTELELRLLAHGNLTQDEALSLTELIRQTLLADTRPISNVQVPVLLLPEQTALVHTLHTDHQDAVLLHYMQAGDNQLETRAAVALLNEIIATPFYTELRTEKQFGYIVFSNLLPMGDLPGIALIVQSSVADPATLNDHTQAFLLRMQETLEVMDDAELERYRNSVRSRLLQPDTSLSSRSQRYWRELDRDSGFSTHVQLADALPLIDRAQLLATLEALQQRHYTLRSHGRFSTEAENWPDNASDLLPHLRQQGAFLGQAQDSIE